MTALILLGILVTFFVLSFVLTIYFDALAHSKKGAENPTPSTIPITFSEAETLLYSVDLFAAAPEPTYQYPAKIARWLQPEKSSSFQSVV